MKITLTKHADKRIKQRKIALKQVEKGLEKPEIVTLESEKENKYAAYRHLNKYSLKIVYVEEEREKRVVTVYKVERKRTENLQNILIKG